MTDRLKKPEIVQTGLAPGSDEPEVEIRVGSGSAVPATRPWRPLAAEPEKRGLSEALGGVASMLGSPAVQGLTRNVLQGIRDVKDMLAGPVKEPSQEIEYVGSIAVRPGDVLAASRLGGLYDHFAVYVGDGRVIHYAADRGDFAGRISIHEAPYEAFENGTAGAVVVDFPDDNGSYSGPALPGHVRASSISEAGLFDAIRGAFYHLYTPGETIARARSRLGEEKYSLPFNNCEHFAIWCKTGVHESHQVNKWMTLLGTWIAGSQQGNTE